MKMPFADRAVMSRLSDDEAYWDALVERVVADAALQLGYYRSVAAPWWRGMARLTAPLAIAASAAVIMAWLWMPDAPRAATAVRPPAVVYGLVSPDRLASRLAMSPAAPAIITLLAIPDSEERP